MSSLLSSLSTLHFTFPFSYFRDIYVCPSTALFFVIIWPRFMKFGIIICRCMTYQLHVFLVSVVLVEEHANCSGYSEERSSSFLCWHHWSEEMKAYVIEIRQSLYTFMEAVCFSKLFLLAYQTTWCPNSINTIWLFIAMNSLNMNKQISKLIKCVCTLQCLSLCCVWETNNDVDKLNRKFVLF